LRAFSLFEIQIIISTFKAARATFAGGYYPLLRRNGGLGTLEFPLGEAFTAGVFIVLGMAAGTFLFMATLHEFQRAPMITRCSTRRGFAVMLAGFLLTALVRYLIGEAHKLG
jgi:hypothetical protein